jgi:hypothetical protein
MEHIVKRLRETGGLDAALMRAAADTIETLTAERDEARRDAERWQADALRLLNERNAAQEERDELRAIANKAMDERDAARREVCYASTLPPRECAEERGWDCWDRKDFCDKL